MKLNIGNVLARHWVINPTTNVGATVRLPYYNSELTALYPASTATTNPIDDIAERSWQHSDP
ncbi:MAG: hypothetical protein R2779_05915 [Crocinitomicaceae bacterium]